MQNLTERYNFDYEEYYSSMLSLLREQGFKLADGIITTRKGERVGAYGEQRHPETKIYKAHSTYFVTITTVQ